MESPKVLNQPATPILIFFLTVSLMLSASVSETYDYLQYVVQWQPAVCSNPNNHRMCKTNFPTQKFTIHGLWPTNFSGPLVRDCKRGPAFKETEVRRIRAELDEYWPDLFDRNDGLPDNENFWSHEWERHGRCYLNVFGKQFSYFNQAVTLGNRYNERIKNILSRAIYPSNNNWWLRNDDIFNKIYQEFNRRPLLICADKYGYRPYNDPKQLQEVILCFDVNGEDLIHCPPRRKTNCPQEILFSL
ncbi:hypothetical protein SLA2020_373640 [Shorea laevis]